MKVYNNLKRIAVISIAVLIIAVCSSCMPVPSEETMSPSPEPTEPVEYVEFVPVGRLKTVKVSKDEIMAYESQYPDCNGTWYKDQLSGDELYAYNAFLYALENCYIEFHIFSENPEMDYYPIREMLSLDSPFLEQNYYHGEFVYRKNKTTWMGYEYVVDMWKFSSDTWELKMEALEKCREIVAGIPEECVTQFEKMEYLYDYVRKNVTYVEYDSVYYPDFLYDAVCKSETICDGYSNMLSLLFNLIGVECCEAMGSDIEDISQATPEEVENARGHTWVVAKVDGEYYNFDATFDDPVGGDQFENNKLFFGHSDQLMPVKYTDYDDMRPKCTDTSRDFIYADIIIDDIDDKTQTDKIGGFIGRKMSDNPGETVEVLIVVKAGLSDNDFYSFKDKYVNNITEIAYVSSVRLQCGSYDVVKVIVKPVSLEVW